MSSALGAVLSFIAVITTVPLLAGTCLGDRALGPPPPVAPGTRLLRWLEPVLARPRRVAAAGLVLTLVLAATATQLRPDYRYREYLPTDHEAFQALSASDAALGGTLSVYALIEWDRAQLAGSALFGVLDDVTAAFEDAPKTHAPVSLATLLDALPGPPGDPAARLALLYYLPQDLVRRWFRLDRGRALVSAQVADEGAAALAPAFEELKGRLHAVAARHPGYRIHLTGLLVVSAESSLTMIGALARSLGLAAALIFGVVMLAFRSVRLGVVSLLPNLFPLATVAALLVWIGHPLQYTSATVFGIALGIAVDDTIHLLSGFQRAQQQGLNAGAALRQSLCRAGSAVVITTVLLVAGFGTLLLSGLPKIRLFGALACAALGVALLCDLILLPAVTLLAFGRTGRTLTSGFAFRHPALLLEAAHTASFGGVSVDVRVDRIDRLPSGGHIVIDYKTGRSDVGSWFGERPREPQLPLYCSSAELDLAGVAYARLSRKALGFGGLAAEASLLPKAAAFAGYTDPTTGENYGSAQDLVRRWRGVLDGLGEGFRSGDARVDPRKRDSPCRTCPLPALCRVHELTLAGAAEDGEEADE